MNPGVVVDTVAGKLQGEILKGLLEAQGIPCELSYEGAGRAGGLVVGPMGEVDLLVAEKDEAAARAVVEAYYSGKLDASPSAGD
jgi:hypothetical protein